jgi:hypothetical protein
MKSGFSFSLNAQSGAIIHTGRYPYLQHLFFVNAPSALTGLAWFVDHAARSVALAAGPAY